MCVVSQRRCYEHNTLTDDLIMFILSHESDVISSASDTDVLLDHESGSQLMFSCVAVMVRALCPPALLYVQ